MPPAPRRFLPSTAALRALEAVDRLGSVTAAAEDLNLTQGAVSRQVQTLEEQLGVPLVIRRGRRVVLTPEAAHYAADIRGGVAEDHAGVAAADGEPDGGQFGPGDIADLRDALAGAAAGGFRKAASGGDDQPDDAATPVQLRLGTL